MASSERGVKPTTFSQELQPEADETCRRLHKDCQALLERYGKERRMEILEMLPFKVLAAPALLLPCLAKRLTIGEMMGSIRLEGILEDESGKVDQFDKRPQIGFRISCDTTVPSKAEVITINIQKSETGIWTRLFFPRRDNYKREVNCYDLSHEPGHGFSSINRRRASLEELNEFQRIIERIKKTYPIS